jgi:hypothetical protein
MNEKTNKDRTAWAEAAKQISLLLLDRREKLQDLCPSNCLADDDDRRQTLKAVCGLNRKLSALLDQMAAQDKNSCVGVKALLGSEPGSLVRTLVSLMVSARFDPSLSRDTRTIDYVIGLVGASDPDDCIAARNLFRADSVIYPHLHIAFGPTLDESGVRFKDSSTNKLLAQPRDETEKITEATALTSRWK